MKPITFLFISLTLLSFDAFADLGNRKPASSLTLADLQPSSEKAKSDQEEIKRKMFNPAPISDSNSRSRVGIEATCTDARNIVRTSKDPLYKDCLEERPRVAKPPMESNSPGATTFGVRISR